MSSMTARRQIRLAALSALQTVAGVNWQSPGEWDIPPTKLPAGRLRVQSDAKQSVSKGSPIFNSTILLEVQLYVTGATDVVTQDTLETVGEQLEEQLLGDPGLVSLVSQFAQVQTDVAIDTSGAAPVGKVDIKVACETVETFHASGPFLDLELLHLHLDSINVFDAAGTYTNPPFPASVNPAPRTAGPDGRDEGTINLDMQTGLPTP